jgi:WD40 repeat protein
MRSLMFSPDGKLLAGGTWRRTLSLWDVATGKLIMKKENDTGPIHAVAFSPDSSILASAGRVRNPNDKDENSFYKPGEIILWDVTAGKPKQTLTGFRTAVESLAFTPDGKTLIAGDFDKELSFWDVPNGKKLAGITGLIDTASYLAISPDGKILVSAHDFSDFIEFWDIAPAKELGRFHSPLGRGGSPTFTPDGRTLIVSGSRVQFWDLAELRKSGVLAQSADQEVGPKK